MGKTISHEKPDNPRESSDPASAAVGANDHPSKSLTPRRKGYGIGGGLERPYRRGAQRPEEIVPGSYGPLPHSGYFGAGSSMGPFKTGEAGFGGELTLYRAQYGEITSGFDEEQ